MHLLWYSSVPIVLLSRIGTEHTLFPFSVFFLDSVQQDPWRVQSQSPAQESELPSPVHSHGQWSTTVVFGKVCIDAADNGAKCPTDTPSF